MFDTAASHLDDLAAFVAAAPTSYHAAVVAAQRLKDAGFAEVDETTAFPSGAGKRYLVRDGAVVAWVQPEQITETTGFRIVGTHTDSPAFKLKPIQPIASAGWTQIAVEIYGGPLINSWLDRELGVAGRVVTRDGATHLVRTGPIARIPQLAIHLDRTVNDGLTLDRQQHTQPVLAVDAGPGLLPALAEQIGTDAEDFLGFDLFTYSTQESARFGLYDEFFASSRLDNLSSTHAALAAIEDLEQTSDVAVFVAFDHEEVGSATASGAAGPLLEDVLTRICVAAGLSQEEVRAMFTRSSCVSADAGHFVHPNYPNHHDPVVRPLPNRGPLTKINAQQRYASDARSIATWQAACDAAEVPTQSFVSNNAIPCGSTIGPITATRLGISTVDVGIGLLSMHSAREMCGAEDPHYLARGIRAYWV